MEQKLLLELAIKKKRRQIFKKEKNKKNEFTGDVVGISLLSHIIQVRKCMGFDALHCGHKIFVLNKKEIYFN
jgi:hypothetical protein